MGTAPGGSCGCRSLVYAERGKTGSDRGGSCGEEPDTSRSEVNLHWRERIREWIGPRIEAAVAREREACARVIEHYGFGQVQSAVEGLLATLAAAIRARGEG